MSKHNDFLNRYGVLTEELKIETLGKFWTITTVIVFILHKFIFAISVVLLYEYPAI